MIEKFEFDFYEEFKLPRPVLCGLVHKITSPKGIRQLNEETQQYHYHLHNDLIQIYKKDETALVDAGIYWIMDVYKSPTGQQWNHYLFIVEPDGVIYPVAEFLHCNDSTWIKRALPYIKDFYTDEPLPPIKLTKYRADNTPKKPKNR